MRKATLTRFHPSLPLRMATPALGRRLAGAGLRRLAGAGLAGDDGGAVDVADVVGDALDGRRPLPARPRHRPPLRVPCTRPVLSWSGQRLRFKGRTTRDGELWLVGLQRRLQKAAATPTGLESCKVGEGLGRGGIGC